MNPFKASSDDAKCELSPPDPDEGVMILSLTGRVVHASPRIAEILGTTQQEVYGRGLWFVQPQSLEKIKNILKSGRVVEPWQHDWTRADGRSVSVITRSMPAEVAGHKVRMVFAKRAKVQPKTQEREAQ